MVGLVPVATVLGRTPGVATVMYHREKGSITHPIREGGGELIRPKRIYKFCLLHACFVLLCHVLLELSYTFEHIWTNLLTQCTQFPVPVFCCFCNTGFLAIKSARKILEKL